MTERAEHERAADLVEVRVIGRRRPTLEREKAERECLEQRVLLLKAEQPTELFTSAALTRFLAFEAGDGSTCVVRVLELPAHELSAHGEISGPLSFLAGFFAYWHGCVDVKKKPPTVSRGLVENSLEASAYFSGRDFLVCKLFRTAGSLSLEMRPDLALSDKYLGNFVSM